MANDLIDHEPTLPGLVPNADVDRLANMFADALVLNEGPPALPRLPTDRERKALQTRCLELARAVRPIKMDIGEQESARKRIALLCNGWSANRGAGIDAAGLVSTYVFDLSDLPLFAILEACDAVTKGRVKLPDARGIERPIDPAYPVSSAQLYAVASKIAEARRRDEAKLRRVLSVRHVLTPEQPPEVRAKIAQGLKDLADSLRMNAVPVDPGLKARVADEAFQANQRNILAEYKAMGMDPIYSEPGVLLSPSAARQNGALMNRRRPIEHPHEESGE